MVDQGKREPIRREEKDGERRRERERESKQNKCMCVRSRK